MKIDWTISIEVVVPRSVQPLYYHEGQEGNEGRVFNFYFFQVLHGKKGLLKRLES